MSATRNPAPLSVFECGHRHRSHEFTGRFPLGRCVAEVVNKGALCECTCTQYHRAESGAPLQPGATQPEHEGVAHETRCRAREWLITGGGGHEDGEDGIRAMTLCGEDLVETLEAYDEWMQERLTTLLERMARLVVEKAAKESHDAAFEYLGMRYKQRAYSWHEIADALAKSAEKIRAIANDKAKLQQLREAVERP